MSIIYVFSFGNVLLHITSIFNTLIINHNHGYIVISTNISYATIYMFSLSAIMPFFHHFHKSIYQNI